MRKIIFITLLLLGLSYGRELRIVSISPYVTENLYLLGEGKNIIGLTLQDNKIYREGKEIIGSMLEPNIEKIVSLKPDIVIASEEGNRIENVRKLETLGIKTLTLPQLFSYREIFKNFLKLAEITGKKRYGEKIVKEAEKKLKKIKFKKRKNVFFILGLKPLITTGKKTFINDIILISGGTNIFGEINRKWIQVNIEEVIKRNPDAIIYIEMGENFNRYLERLNGVKAVKNRKILKIEPYKIASPTPESFVDACIQINKFLNEN